MAHNTEELLRENNTEELFRKMARSYAEQYGRELRRENAALTDDRLKAQDSGGNVVGNDVVGYDVVGYDVVDNVLLDNRNEIPGAAQGTLDSHNEIPDSRNAIPDIRIASLDRKVRRRMDLRFLPQPLARAKPSAAIALAAACLVCALLTVLVPLSNRGGERSANSGRQIAEVAATTQSPESSYKRDRPGIEDSITAESDAKTNDTANADRSTGANGNSLAAAEPAPSIQAQTPVVQFEQIALKKELPQEYTVAEVKQDGDKTIYHIESATLDDMIITLAKTSEDRTKIAGQDAAREQAGFIKVDLLLAGGQALEAKALSKADYNLLAFRTDGIDYELSCKYDINSLLTLGTYLI